jgi:hypothetical protein
VKAPVILSGCPVTAHISDTDTYKLFQIGRIALWRTPDEMVWVLDRLALAFDRHFANWLWLPRFQRHEWGWRAGWLYLLVIWYPRCRR